MSLNIKVETKLDSQPCKIAWDSNTLFVGTEDGSIKTFDGKLSPKESWAAHAVQLFALAANGGRVYSASNDGGVRVWSTAGHRIAFLPSSCDVGAIQVFDKFLYVGDEDGNITVYEDNVKKAQYNVLEEVKDLCLVPPYLYTARDLDVTVTEITPDESKSRFLTRHTMEGRAPLLVTNNRLLIMARGGNSLRLHYASVKTSCKMLDEVKISDMIITSMSASGNYVWTGGWDGYIKRWNIAGDQLEAAGDINLGGCVNAVIAMSDCVYAAVAGGRVVCVVPA